MKKHIYIVGIGTGKGQITMAAADILLNAELVLGASRMIKLCEDICFDKEVIIEYQADKIMEIIEESDACSVAILVSGDTGFYSVTKRIVEVLNHHEVTVMPGISSVCAMSARIGIPWQDMRLLSCHGRGCNLIDEVRRNHYTFALTGDNVCELLNELNNKGFGELSIYIGINLDMDEEKVLAGTVSQLRNGSYGSLAVLVIVNEEYDDSARIGIADDSFIRSDVPMTKSEVRAVTMSKLSIRPDSVCMDIGCGTGSVTVEMALAAYRGHVYSIDKEKEAVELTLQNVDKFHIGNVTVLEGMAPDKLKEIKDVIPDRAFIGGSTGHIDAIVDYLIALNPNIKIVINAIVIETMSQSVQILESRGFEVDVTELHTSRSRKAGNNHMMMAQNSVYIITGKK